MSIQIEVRNRPFAAIYEDALYEMAHYEHLLSKFGNEVAGENPAYTLAWSEQSFTNAARLELLTRFVKTLHDLVRQESLEQMIGIEAFAGDLIKILLRLDPLGSTSTSFAQNAMNVARLQATAWLLEKLIVRER